MKTALASALPFILCAVVAAAQDAGPQPPDAAAAQAMKLSAGATDLFNQKKYDEAAPLAEQAVAAWERARGAEHPDVARALYDLGLVRLGQGRFADAELSLTRSLAIYEKTPPGHDLKLARVLNALAVARHKQGHEDDSLKHARRALQAAEAALGPEHVELVEFVKLVADIQRQRGDRGRAEDNYLRLIRLLVKGEKHEDARVDVAYEALLCMAASGGQQRQDALRRKLDEALNRKPLTGGDMDGKAISKPPPAYPPEAKYGRIQGGVVVRIWVNEAGQVTRAEAVCGHPALAGASVVAARKARFRAPVIDGEPVKVSGYITYNFVIQ